MDLTNCQRHWWEQFFSIKFPYHYAGSYAIDNMTSVLMIEKQNREINSPEENDPTLKILRQSTQTPHNKKLIEKRRKKLYEKIEKRRVFLIENDTVIITIDPSVWVRAI